MKATNRVVRKVHKQRARKLIKRGEQVERSGNHWLWHVPQTGFRSPK